MRTMRFWNMYVQSRKIESHIILILGNRKIKGPKLNSQNGLFIISFGYCIVFLRLLITHLVSSNLSFLYSPTQYLLWRIVSYKVERWSCLNKNATSFCLKDNRIRRQYSHRDNCLFPWHCVKTMYMTQFEINCHWCQGYHENVVDKEHLLFEDVALCIPLQVSP